MPKYKANKYESFATTGYLENGTHFFTDVNGKKRKDSNIAITTSMMLNPAYLDLTPSQRELYRIAIYQFRSAADRPSKHNADEKFKDSTYIYLNWNLNKVFKIYGAKNNKGFYGDIKALVEHGFIIPVKSENNQRTIFKLTDAWKEFEQGAKYIETNTKNHTWEWVRVTY